MVKLVGAVCILGAGTWVSLIRVHKPWRGRYLAFLRE